MGNAYVPRKDPRTWTATPTSKEQAVGRPKPASQLDRPSPLKNTVEPARRPSGNTADPRAPLAPVDNLPNGTAPANPANLLDRIAPVHPTSDMRSSAPSRPAYVPRQVKPAPAASPSPSATRNPSPQAAAQPSALPRPRTPQAAAGPSGTATSSEHPSPTETTRPAEANDTMDTDPPQYAGPSHAPIAVAGAGALPGASAYPSPPNAIVALGPDTSVADDPERRTSDICVVVGGKNFQVPSYILFWASPLLANDQTLARLPLICAPRETDAPTFNTFLVLATTLQLDATLPATQLGPLLRLLQEWQCRPLLTLAAERIDAALAKRTIHPLKALHLGLVADSETLRIAGLCAAAPGDLGGDKLYHTPRRTGGWDVFSPDNWSLPLWIAMNTSPGAVWALGRAAAVHSAAGEALAERFETLYAEARAVINGNGV